MFIPHRRMNIVLVVAGLVLLGLAGWHWSSVMTSSLQKGVVTVGVIGDGKKLRDLSPNGTVERVKYLPQSAVYETLVSYDEVRGLRPVLLDEWRYEDKGKIVRLRLKRGIYFHNGKELTAADIKKCWEKTLKRVASPEAYSLFLPITGAREYAAGKSDEIIGLVALKPDTLLVKLEKPDVFFVSSLVHPAFFIYDSSDETGLGWAGTGPFSLKEVKGKQVKLEANPRYHGERPRISHLEFMAYPDSASAIGDYRQGKIMIVDEVEPAELKKIENDSQTSSLLLKQPLYAFFACAFNLNEEPFRDNYLLRRALNYGIDRQAIVRDIFSQAAIPIKGPLPTGIPGYRAETRGYDYNPELSRQLLADAGFPGGEYLPTITLYYVDEDGYRELANAISEQLRAVGVQVKPEGLEPKRFLYEVKSMRHQACLVGWQADYPEGYSILSSLYSGYGSCTGYRNETVDSLLNQASALFKQEKERKLLVDKAARCVIDDAPMLWICQPSTAKLKAKEIDGLKVNALNQIDWTKIGCRHF